MAVTRKTLVGPTVALVLMATVMETASFARDLPPGQRRKPDFVAHLDAGQAEVPSASPATGKASFWLDDKDLALHYSIRLRELDLTGYVTCSQPLPGCDATMAFDDVIGIHFHAGPPGVSGPHVLNVYKAPSDDDADLVVKPHAGVVRGRWDDGDENLSLPVPSRKLSELIDDLCEGRIYVAVHTTDYPLGAIRGQVIPEGKACERRHAALSQVAGGRSRRP